MDPSLFVDAKLKVERANQHISEFNQIVMAFVETDFYRFGIDMDEDTGHYILNLRFTQHPPAMMNLVVGEAINGLRSALDYMMWELVSLCGGTPHDKLSFPITKTREKLVAALKDQEIETIDTDIITLIRDEIKPYAGGNDFLCALHTLNNIDKHRLPIVSFSVIEVDGIEGWAGTNYFSNIAASVGESGILNMFKTREPFLFKNYGVPQFHIVFGQGQPLEGKSIIPTLKQFLQLVEGIIQNVERVYLARA